MVDEQINIQFNNLIDGGDDHPLFDEQVGLEIVNEVINLDLMDVCSIITVEELQDMEQDLPEI